MYLCIISIGKICSTQQNTHEYKIYEEANMIETLIEQGINGLKPEMSDGLLKADNCHYRFPTSVIMHSFFSEKDYADLNRAFKHFALDD